MFLGINPPCDIHIDLYEKEPNILNHWVFKSNMELLQKDNVFRIKEPLYELSSNKERVSIDTIRLVKKMVMICCWS